MSEKVAVAGITKEPGYLYFLDKDGDIGRSKMARSRAKDQPKPPKEKVKILGVQKEKGYLYFVDKDGDVSRSPMARGK